MIVLKILLTTLLVILLVILGLILLVLILPVGGELSFIDGKLNYKVKLWFLNIMDSGGGGLLGWLKKRKKKPKKKKKPKEEPLAEEETAPKPQNEELSGEKTETETVTVTAEAESSEEMSEAEEVQAEIDDEELEELLADAVDVDDESSKKKKKKEKKSSDKDKSERSGKIDFILSTIDAAWSPLKRIFKGFRFSDFYIDFVLADEDAYKCAINYGRFCGIIYNGIALLSRIFTVRLKTVDVQPGFGLNKSRYDASFRVDFRAGTLVIAGLAFLITFIFKVFIPNKLKKRKLRKSAAVQK